MTLPDKTTKREEERGQALLMVSIGIAFLLGVLGLVVDVGYGYFIKQTQQAAADAGANAAAIAAAASGGACGGAVLCQTGYSCPASPTNSTNFGVACLYAQANAFSNASGETVTVSSGTGTPPSVSGLTTTYWVTVTATQPQHLGFLAGLGLKGGNVSAQATGAVVGGSAAGTCIIALDTSMSQAFWVEGSGSVNSNCAIHDNSTNTEAMWAEGSSTTTASVIDVAGGLHQTGTSTITPAPTLGAAAIADPLASLPAPTYSGCNQTSYHLTGSASATINPGVYCGGISITGSVQLTLNPGVYVLNGGGLSLTGCCTTVTGNGVFFYNTSNGYSFGALTTTGGSTLTLTAPTSGTYRGILFFQDRNITSSATNALVGGSNPNFSGTVYMPTGALQFSGSSTPGFTMALIADSIKITGSTHFLKDTSNGALLGFGGSAAYMVQ